MPLRPIRGSLLMVLLLVSATAGAAAPARELVLFDFEANGGSLNLGGEFPGAEGQFAVAPAAAHDGQQGGRLSFDLTKGAYVAWGLDLATPLVAGAQTLAVWARTDAAGRRVHCKTRDATGQEHLRNSAVLPANTWQRLVFEVEKMDAHWGGANDGKIHWPLSYVQLGVDPGPTKVGTLDLDTLTVTTTATPREQSGGLKLASPHFGNLFAADEAPTFNLAATMLDATPRRYTGTWRAIDWQEREAGHGAVTLGQPLTLPHLPAGAFRLEVELHDATDAAVVLRATTWFGVLQGPNPTPCGWVGTCTHGGHGWGYNDLRYLDLMNAAGIGVVRDEFGWSGIERVKGQYATSKEEDGYVDGLNRHGIKLNLLLTYGNSLYANPLDPDAYARWAGWMAQHYQGRVHDFEIWNEPANFSFREHYPGERDGKPAWVAPFVELTRKAGAAIRAARPDASIVLCAEDGWGNLQAELTSGIGSAGAGGAGNVIGIHPYCHGQPRPEREWFFRDGGAELRRLSAANGGPSRVVITEAGWTTYEGTMQYLAIAGGYPRSSLVHQAQYLVRMYLSARAADVGYSTQYDFRDDGPNRSYTENNFGLVHEDYSPKPSLLAIGAMTRLVGQGKFVRDAAPDPAAARAYVFDVGGSAVVCAYAIEKDVKLTLPVGADRLEQADLMGNRSPLAAPGGKVTLDLTERPIYLIGAKLDALAHYVAASVKDPELTVAAGDVASTTVRIENHTGHALPPALTVAAPKGTAVSVSWPKPTTDVPEGGSVEGTVTLRVSGAAQAPFAVTLRGGRGWEGIDRKIQVRPTPPVSVQVGPAYRNGDAWAGEAALRNDSQRPLTITAQITAPLVTAPPVQATLQPGETAHAPYSLVKWPAAGLPLRLDVRTADGYAAKLSVSAFPGSVPALAAAPKIDGDLSDWAAFSTLLLDNASQYVPELATWGGRDDLSATVRLAWCTEGLCVGVEVRDNVFDQPYQGEDVWRADAVQLAMVRAGTHGDGRYEVGLARTAKGDQTPVYSRFPDAPAGRVQFASRLANQAGGLTYEALVPWSVLPGFVPTAGKAFAFSLLLNDADGAGRRGWLEAFSGIGKTKDPSLYGVLRLSERL